MGTFCSKKRRRPTDSPSKTTIIHSQTTDQFHNSDKMYRSVFMGNFRLSLGESALSLSQHHGQIGSRFQWILNSASRPNIRHACPNRATPNRVKISIRHRVACNRVIRGGCIWVAFGFRVRNRTGRFKMNCAFWVRSGQFLMPVYCLHTAPIPAYYGRLCFLRGNLGL